MALLTRGRPGRTGRGRAHAGRRGAERVVTRPGAGTLLAARRRRARAAAWPAARLATSLAALTTLAATAALRNVRHGRPGRRRARRGGGPLRSGGLRGGTGRTRYLPRYLPRYLRDGPRRGPAGRRRRSRRGARSLGAADTVSGGRSARHGTHRTGRGRSRRPGATGLWGSRAGTPVILPVPIPGRTVAGLTRRCLVCPARAAAARRAGTAGPPLRPGSLSLLAPIGAESFFEPAHDRRLDRRGRRTYELTHFLELDHHGLALNTELFREFVNPDLRHYAPLLGPVSWTLFTRTFPPVRGRACSGLTSACGVHRLVLIERSSLSRPAFPTGCRSCLSLCPVRRSKANRWTCRPPRGTSRTGTALATRPYAMPSEGEPPGSVSPALAFPRAGARADWPGWLARYLLTSAAPSGPGVRKARPNARRRCASSRHARLWCR